MFYKRCKHVFSILLAGMPLLSGVAFCATPEEVSTALKKIVPAPIASVFANKLNLLGDAPIDVEMAPVSVPMVDLNGHKLLVAPLQLQRQGEELSISAAT